MKVIKKFTAIILDIEKINDIEKVNFNYGEITGPHYSRDYPKKSFESEEEAIQYAFKTDRYSKWVVLPTIEFSYLDED